jgi:hypothetical protein
MQPIIAGCALLPGPRGAPQEYSTESTTSRILSQQRPAYSQQFETGFRHLWASLPANSHHMAPSVASPKHALEIVGLA